MLSEPPEPAAFADPPLPAMIPPFAECPPFPAAPPLAPLPLPAKPGSSPATVGLLPQPAVIRAISVAPLAAETVHRAARGVDLSMGELACMGEPACMMGAQLRK